MIKVGTGTHHPGPVGKPRLQPLKARTEILRQDKRSLRRTEEERRHLHRSRRGTRVEGERRTSQHNLSGFGHVHASEVGLEECPSASRVAVSANSRITAPQARQKEQPFPTAPTTRVTASLTPSDLVHSSSS